MPDCLTAHEQHLLTLARAGTFPPPAQRKRRDIDALQILIGLGLISPTEPPCVTPAPPAAAHKARRGPRRRGTDPSRVGFYRDGDAISLQHAEEFKGYAPYGWTVIHNGQHLIVKKERP